MASSPLLLLLLLLLRVQCVSGSGQASSSFESRVVVVCEKMMSRACWAKSKHLIHSKTFRGMTLLHLAAGQGYATLIQTLIKWRYGDEEPPPPPHGLAARAQADTARLGCGER